MNVERWNRLSPRTRRTITALAALEGLLKVVALVDLRRRDADQVRGSKRTWALAVTLINSGGLVPLTYLLRGRRPRP